MQGHSSYFLTVTITSITRHSWRQENTQQAKQTFGLNWQQLYYALMHGFPFSPLNTGIVFSLFSFLEGVAPEQAPPNHTDTTPLMKRNTLHVDRMSFNQCAIMLGDNDQENATFFIFYNLGHDCSQYSAVAILCQSSTTRFLIVSRQFR